MAGEKNLNRLQVENGWAVAYGEFEAEETAARLNRMGLWAGTFDRPREWRDQHGDLAEIAHGAFGRILDWLRQILGLS
jgi:endonuclease YncB( thermonuclease family)